MKIKSNRIKWLNVGRKLFAEEGISAINIVRLSKVVGTSKSSFYFLFKTRENYLIELIEHWGTESTDRIIEEIEIMKNPVKQFKKLMVLAYTDYENNKFLMHLRVYATQNEFASKLLNKIEKRRLKISSDVLEHLGFSKEESKKKAYDIYYYYLGFFEFHKNKKITTKKIISTIDELFNLLHISEVIN